MSKFNEKLEILLANNDMRQKDLAEMVIASPSAVQKWVKGINQPDISTLKQLSKYFCISLDDLTDDDRDIIEYCVVDHYVPYFVARKYPDIDEEKLMHTIIDAGLAHEGILHRFINVAGDKCSAIYRGRKEVWWHYREKEPEMIRYWNEVYSYDK